MPKSARKSFVVPVVLGHKGPAVVFAFDPAELFGARTRHFVEGVVAGCAFEGEIGIRRGACYSAITPRLAREAALVPGTEVKISIGARSEIAVGGEPKVMLAWLRAVGEPAFDSEAEAAAMEPYIARGPFARMKKPRAKKK